MKGARPLSNDEILLVADQFDGTFAIRKNTQYWQNGHTPRIDTVLEVAHLRRNDI